MLPGMADQAALYGALARIEELGLEPNRAIRVLVDEISLPPGP
jgi:hypothetical protein